MQWVSRLAVLLALSLPLPASARAVLSLRPPTSPPPGTFGAGVGAFGGNILVGAPNTQTPGFGHGTAYLLDGVTGAVLQTFTNPQFAVPTWFGGSFAALGSKVVVGDYQAYVNGVSDGRVYVFDAATGTLLLTIPDPNSGDGTGVDRFGGAIAVLGDDLLIGSPGDDASLLDAGAAYLIDGTSGAVLRTFLSPSPQFFGAFGGPVATLGPNVVIGALGEAGGGRVHLFDGTTGALIRTYVAPVTGGGFGASVATLGDDLLVGSLSDDTAGPDAGAAYLVDSATGAVLQTYLNPTPGAWDAFGSGVAVLGDDVLVSAPFEDLGGEDSGAVYLFDGATGALLRTLANPTPAADDFFGLSLAVLGDAVIVGAYEDDSVVEGGGSAYVFCGGAAGCGPCETCGPLGSCVTAPNPTCRGTTGPAATRLRLRNGARDESDVVVWKGDVQAIDRGELGAPELDEYAACLFEESTPTPSLLFRASAPADGLCRGRPCWKSSARTVHYSDADRTPDGIRVLHLLHFPTQGRAFLRFVAKGTNLSGRPFPLPTPPLPTPFSLQLQVQDGACWEAAFSGANATANGAGLFVSPSD